jgi:hypothetical protein
MMKKLVMTWQGTSLLFLLLVVVLFSLALVHDSIKNSTKVWEGTCTFISWEEKDGKVEKMKVKCDDKEGYVKDSDLIIAYLRNSVPFPGILYESGKVEMKKPDAKK